MPRIKSRAGPGQVFKLFRCPGQILLFSTFLDLVRDKFLVVCDRSGASFFKGEMKSDSLSVTILIPIHVGLA